MKVTYDWDEHTKTYVCSACGYKYTEETKAYSRAIEGDDKFIEMEDFALHSTDRSDYYHQHKSHTVYACPKCGVLQIQI